MREQTCERQESEKKERENPDSKNERVATLASGKALHFSAAILGRGAKYW